MSNCAFLSIETASKDLDSFAKHAGRTTITTEDVMLLTRRNEGLEEVIRKFIETEKANKRSR
jgi:centromere protein S